MPSTSLVINKNSKVNGKETTDNDDKDLVSLKKVSSQRTPSIKGEIEHKIKSEKSSGNVTVVVDGFGVLENPLTERESTIVQRYTFFNRNRMSVQVITYGATVTKMSVPNRFGVSEDILMGFDNLDDYQSVSNPYIGCTIGRVFNKIRSGNFILHDKTIQLTKNYMDRHHDNGGIYGFDRFNWTPCLNKTVLTLTHVSEDGWEGYTGCVMVRATFELKNDNSFHISYSAVTTKPTPINVTLNLPFNLAGHCSGHKELYKHIVSLNADKYIVTDHNHIPNGKIQCVHGTIYDLRIPHELSPAISRCIGGGYNTPLCLTKGTEQQLTFAARVLHPESGRVLELYTDQPIIQFYTCNAFPDPDNNINPPEVHTQDFYEIPSTVHLSKITNSECEELYGERVENEGEGSCVCSSNCTCVPMIGGSCSCSPLQHAINGKDGAQYMRHGGFCLNPQQYPDAMNFKHFPNPILHPGQVYKNVIVYKFGINLATCGKPKMFDADDEDEKLDEEEIIAEEYSNKILMEENEAESKISI